MSQKTNRKYKATIILDTRGYESPVETLEEKVTDLFKELGGDLQSLENLGRHDFTRITEKDHAGDTYLSVVVSGEPGLPAAFHERVRLDPLIKRSMFNLA